MTKIHSPTSIRRLKISLALALLLCLLSMPYVYYLLIRWGAMISFLFLAYDSFRSRKKGNKLMVYLLLALIFQPFEHLAFGRTLWCIIDVLVASWLLWQALGKRSS